MRDYSRFDLSGALRRAQAASVRTHTPRYLVMNAIGYSLYSKRPLHSGSRLWIIEGNEVKEETL